VDTRREMVVQTLQQVLGSSYEAAGTFGLRWVRWSKSQPRSIRRRYKHLKELGLSDRQIADNVTLLAVPQQAVKETYEFLNSVGLNKKVCLPFPSYFV